ncbi:MAG TPA: hypothetical protein VLH79_09080, partial [Chthonomonadales bacterium]|nr:hypothetical protein [Chthonomonadales bacterium]
RETYGMSEMAAAASECEYGALHLWPEAGVVEVMEGTDQVAAGQTGDLVCTSLIKTDMPLIRYRVGDRGALAPPSHRCPCGRTLPILLRVEGRCDDYVYHADGRARLMGSIEGVLGLDTPVVEAQFVQRELGSIHVRYVPAPEFTERTAGVLRRRVRERLGDVRVSLEPMSAIPRGANGKLRLVVCDIPPEQRPDRGEVAPPSGA